MVTLLTNPLKDT